MQPENTYLTVLADFYSGISFDEIPSPVVEKTRRTLFDFLGALAVGYIEGDLAKIYLSLAKETGGAEESTILCDGSKVPSDNAAMAMGIMAHSIELDDGHRWGTSHPAVAIIPAVLALGEKVGASFSEILKGIVIGYDAMLRVARAINPSHLKRGFHSTGTCGSIGAAAGCASILRLSPERFAFAMSMGGLQSAGLQEMLHDYPGIKPLQAGRAASSGVFSAVLADRGAKSPRTLFEGTHGWLKAMCDGDFSEEALIGDLGQRWEILFTYTKFYPTCRHCHAAIDLAKEARDELGCRGEDVETIVIRTYSLGAAEVGQISLPKNFEEAMFSMPFSVALALENGSVALSDYSIENLKDEQMRKLSSAVRIEIDEEMDARYPEERGAWIKVITKDGRCFERGIPVAMGEPENPATDETLYKKVSDMLCCYYDFSFVDELWSICVLSDLSDIVYGDIVSHFEGGRK